MRGRRKRKSLCFYMGLPYSCFLISALPGCFITPPSSPACAFEDRPPSPSLRAHSPPDMPHASTLLPALALRGRKTETNHREEEKGKQTHTRARPRTTTPSLPFSLGAHRETAAGKKEILADKAGAFRSLERYTQWGVLGIRSGLQPSSPHAGRGEGAACTPRGARYPAASLPRTRINVGIYFRARERGGREEVVGGRGAAGGSEVRFSLSSLPHPPPLPSPRVEKVSRVDIGRINVSP